jgi:predicted RNA binding protein YcfA (HicA-like mRNA interferase family)
MLALPHLSGSECIAILARHGFRRQRRAGGLATLQRGSEPGVVVPESATLGPALLAAILRAAGVDPLDFLRALEEQGPIPVPPISSTSAVA